MTTAVAASGNRTMESVARPRRSLEELVDRVIATLFPAQTEEAKASARRSMHEARRLRQAGDVDGALEALGSVNVAKATPSESRWAFSEWNGLVKRRFGDREVLVYTQGTGRAAALVSHSDGMLEVVSALGMRWRPGKLVSERSLRGLRPLVSSTGQALGEACP